jgi:hypothetical protein
MAFFLLLHFPIVLSRSPPCWLGWADHIRDTQGLGVQCASYIHRLIAPHPGIMVRSTFHKPFPQLPSSCTGLLPPKSQLLSCLWYGSFSSRKPWMACFIKCSFSAIHFSFSGKVVHLEKPKEIQWDQSDENAKWRKDFFCSYRKKSSQKLKAFYFFEAIYFCGRCLYFSSRHTSNEY